MIGLDTSAIIDIFKGEEKIKQFLDNSKEPLAVTIMSYLELFFGLDPLNPKHSQEASYYIGFFDNMYELGLTRNACEDASRIFRNLKKNGKTTEQFDCVIAAIFLSHGITTILTRNSRHFENIEGLKVLSY